MNCLPRINIFQVNLAVSFFLTIICVATCNKYLMMFCNIFLHVLMMVT